MSRRHAGPALALLSIAAIAPALPGVAGAAAPVPEVARFAIVIGNNRSDVAETPNLRYADDDAVAMHRLLLQAGVDSLLLVRLDDDSRQANPGLAPQGAPRGKDVDDAFAALTARIRARARQGSPTELIFVYSGHGGVDGGEGYVALEDRRLTRSMLYDLLARSPATRNHVFIDACKSYFLVFDRGPGGRREPYQRPFALGTIPAWLANTGFVLSTSSDRDSHEWERYQAGILSYEVRSALRGGADADGDQRVTYAELGAFIATANKGIASTRFRPDFLVRPPGRDLGVELLRWRADAATVRLEGVPVGHVYAETAHGERLLDANPDPRQRVSLYLPDERPLFLRTNDETAEAVVTNGQLTPIARLTPAKLEVTPKGALHLAFTSLFASTFGAEDVAAFARRFAATVALDDAGGPEPRGPRATVGLVAGSVAIGAAAGGVTLSLLAWRKYSAGENRPQTELPELNRTVHDLNVASIVCYAVAAAAGLTWGATRLWPDTTLSVSPPNGSDGATTIGFGSTF
jgi:hypothetical protein